VTVNAHVEAPVTFAIAANRKFEDPRAIAVSYLTHDAKEIFDGMPRQPRLDFIHFVCTAYERSKGIMGAITAARRHVSFRSKSTTGMLPPSRDNPV